MQAPQNKHHIGPSKNCTDETTSVNKSLTFGDFQAQNQGGNGIRQKSVKTPLFRLPTNQSLIEERHSIERLKNGKSITVASNNIGITAINKPMAKAATVVTIPNSIYLNKPCTTQIRKFLSLNPPLHGNMNSPVTSPVACFNGGGIASPLCHCGRRTRRRAVINPGPNQGRAFSTCSFSHGRTTSDGNADKEKSKSGCKFFPWEVRSCPNFAALCLDIATYLCQERMVLECAVHA
ncbi:unnamed protein product, partial [Porites evermanni]